ncbi:uncharacterized protein LOC111068967 isoform X2 [Drosophila obscura]|uniref:uncharacterized protein LOC111068967 isoform X2 n=1 Tax=Drosophila obscura TaxID=7282 RepID=UPI001BB0E7D9|nr:uncharacterized protein LOC111068967 isoform X2 [Drosophila obscura]
MNDRCRHCQALKFKGEADGMCCASGKVKLPELGSPPQPLSTLLNGLTPESNHFLNNIRNYNSSFQMTSFGATNIIRDNFMPTFKIQGQIYHRDHQFFQLYFIGNAEDEADRRCAIITNTRRQIIFDLQNMFHEHNELVQVFKTSLDRMPSDDHKIVIRADKTPVGEHARRLNAQTVDEVAIFIVGEQFNNRDIVLHRRNEQLERVSETHRCYDALQYPILLWSGQDGYSFNIKMINPVNGREGTKKVSAMNYYAYILRCRALFHHYIVDMYAKIESERLNFFRFNQSKLRSEEYVHLRDAINNDGNAQNVGTMIILPSSYVGSPRRMFEYPQDATSYVRRYGRPNLFITFTCNPQWEEISELLFVGQTSKDRHDILARFFRQKLKSLMDLIVKHGAFGSVQCWMYSIEWQKRGLPHAHILIWLIEKIRPNQIDDVISAEIPDPTVDPELFEVITKNMIHGLCGALNLNSPCMVEEKCSKRFPKKFGLRYSDGQRWISRISASIN